MAGEFTVYIGTYDKNGGQGLVPLTIAADRSLAAGNPYAGARNASFGVLRGDLAYLVDEQDQGAIGVHRQTSDGWQPLVREPSAGAAPCYLSLDPAGERLAVANYDSGSAALYTLANDRLPQGLPAVFQDEGHGPDEDRQAGPHLHCVRFVGDVLYAVDLGADHVVRLTLSGGRFKDAAVAFTAPAGAGPRHLLFHPSGSWAFLNTELAATLTLLAVGPLGLEGRRTLPTAPIGFSGENAGGHLALNKDGTRVYASNRGHDSIAVFAFEDGALRLLRHAPTGGCHPRHFVLLEDLDMVVVAHEKDSRVTCLHSRPDGTLGEPHSGVKVPGACFVLA